MGGESDCGKYVMGIKDKSTYGEYYWAMQVEAAKAIAEDTEKELCAMASRLMGRLDITEVLPNELKDLFDEIEAPAGGGLSEIGGRFVSEIADGAVSKAASPLMDAMGYRAYMKHPTKKLTAAATAQLFSRKRVTEGFFLERSRMGGFEPLEAQFQYESQMPYPTIPELVIYSRYHGDPDNPWSEVQKWFDIMPREWPVWKWLGLQRLSTLDVQTLHRRGLIDENELFEQLAQIGWSVYDRPLVAEMGWLVPNAMLMVQGDLQSGQRTERLLSDISLADINPKYAQTYLDAVLTKPASSDIIAYNLRIDPKLSDLDQQLRKIGIHPNYFDIYKTLAYPIPPVADIITMAVREAFTPSIAERFGQYEDFPPDFEKYAAMKGLSSDWAKRYWAAHWSLPSPQQGYEMLHRGIVNESELFMLMKALDIMPFWRTKLMQMSYRRLTRVDVRRMYKAGVLSQAEVYEAYVHHGYNPENAKRMTEFTVQWALPKHASITRSDILTAYKNRMITRTESAELLAAMGETYFHYDFMLKAVDYKKGLELTENKIKGIRNLYKRQVYDENKTIDELLKLDLPTEEVSDLMQIWYYEIKAEPPRHWTTAQTLSFIKAELITKDRGIVELKAIGYDDEHINVYVRSIE